MNPERHEVGTVTEVYEETIEDRYKRCGLLNAVQHIDIFGRSRCSYNERTQFRTHDAIAVSSISSCGRYHNTRESGPCPGLSKLSVTTRVSTSPGRRARCPRVTNTHDKLTF